MKLSREGLTLWYGTADAPAPEDVETGRRGVSVAVGVAPPNPCNSVAIRYRVDGGPLRTVAATPSHTDHGREVQYFRALFPDFWTGERVDYVPVLSCIGRTVPGPGQDEPFPSTFRLGSPLLPRSRTPTAAEPASQAPAANAGRERAPFSLDFLGSIWIPFKPPEIIGATPAGIKVTWYWAPQEGTFVGPGLTAKVLPVGGDWMTIRPDGIGIIGAHATLRTSDGALLYAEYSGVLDLGEDGYSRFLSGRWPDTAPTRTSPRFYTAHPKYLWINRLQCLGIGAVHFRELAYTYDLYAVR